MYDPTSMVTVCSWPADKGLMPILVALKPLTCLASVCPVLWQKVSEAVRRVVKSRLKRVALYLKKTGLKTVSPLSLPA